MSNQKTISGKVISQEILPGQKELDAQRVERAMVHFKALLGAIEALKNMVEFQIEATEKLINKKENETI